MQRLRITFGKGEQVKYITHLDLIRLWERVFRRAGLPLLYSQGFTPHPKIAIAAPLAVGVTSEGELMDVELERRVNTVYCLKRLIPQLPPGIEVFGIQEVSPRSPSLQSIVRFAEYRVQVATEEPLSQLRERIAQIMQATTLPRERLRDKEIRRYDLRPLIEDLWILSFQPGTAILGMLLQTDEHATGRPDEVLVVMGLAEAPRDIHRVRLILEEKPIVDRHGRKIRPASLPASGRRPDYG